MSKKVITAKAGCWEPLVSGGCAKLSTYPITTYIILVFDYTQKQNET